MSLSLPLAVSRSSVFTAVAHLLFATLLAVILSHGLLAALLPLLLVYTIEQSLTPWVSQRLPNHSARLMVLSLLFVLIVALFTLAGFLAAKMVISGALSELADRILEGASAASAELPEAMSLPVPEDLDSLLHQVAQLLSTNLHLVQSVGVEASRVAIYLLIGLALGALLAWRQAVAKAPTAPLAAALTARAEQFANAFRQVIGAQLRISLANTSLTAIYLYLVLPAFGVHLPLRPTLLAVTFVAGLMPIIGNILSNTVTVLVSFLHSFWVAIASLIFLVVIHKFEYFLNARIIGAHINARAWELLSAMLVLEAVFGLSGLIAAPVVYAWLKTELTESQWV